MFVLFATKPLNDGTQGFRFNFVGVKGLTRKRTTHRSAGVLNPSSVPQPSTLAIVQCTLKRKPTVSILGVNLDTSQDKE